MKTLSIPKQPIKEYESISERMKFLSEVGAFTKIDQVNWPDQFAKVLPVSVHVAHDNENLFLLYKVEGEQLRAVNTKDFESVWEDSCVEFFMQREGEQEYRNFECNALGTLLASKRFSRDTAVKLTDQMPGIFRFSTIYHRYQNDTEVSDWSLYLEIPKSALGFQQDESLAGQNIRGNFYKCGDETPEPHFLSWSPIETEKPDFHQPKFFGLLELENE
ncbi:MAG: carbohydrate-binding family 9-like protein [Dysgonamonadaceae bacterium]|jgi:hypothetical protein|nr:carbohydrate-binding family 9-like protein [Dysgonamonadaceae bacterium]